MTVARPLAYIEVTESGIDRPGLLIRLIGELLPKANPDFEALYPHVRMWYLELDSKDGSIRREIGLDSKGKPIVVGPYRGNYGVWTDSPPFREWAKEEKITAEEFERTWNSFCPIRRA